MQFVSLALEGDPGFAFDAEGARLDAAPRLERAWEAGAGRVRPKPKPRPRAAEVVPKVIEPDLTRPVRSYGPTRATSRASGSSTDARLGVVQRRCRGRSGRSTGTPAGSSGRPLNENGRLRSVAPYVSARRGLDCPSVGPATPKARAAWSGARPPRPVGLRSWPPVLGGRGALVDAVASRAPAALTSAPGPRARGASRLRCARSGGRRLRGRRASPRSEFGVRSFGAWSSELGVRATRASGSGGRRVGWVFPVWGCLVGKGGDGALGWGGEGGARWSGEHQGRVAGGVGELAIHMPWREVGRRRVKPRGRPRRARCRSDPHRGALSPAPGGRGRR